MTAPAEAPTGGLWAALALAQSRARGVAPDRRNQHQRYDYASAEAVLAAATEAMTGTGLALLRVSATVESAEGGPWLRSVYMLTCAGDAQKINQTWPIGARKGSSRDKLLAGALTSSLAYMLRDLLLMPRVEPGIEMDARDEGQQQPPPARPQRPRHASDPGSAPRRESPEAAQARRENADKAARRARASESAAQREQRQSGHDPDWSHDRAGFCAELGRRSISYEALCRALEARSLPRPAAITSERRIALLAALDAGKISIEGT